MIDTLVAHEDVVVIHASCNRADDNARVVVGGMDHLTATDVNAGVVRVDHDIARLRIGHTGPAHEGAGGAKTAVTASEAVAYKA